MIPTQDGVTAFGHSISTSVLQAEGAWERFRLNMLWRLRAEFPGTPLPLLEADMEREIALVRADHPDLDEYVLPMWALSVVVLLLPAVCKVSEYVEWIYCAAKFSNSMALHRQNSIAPVNEEKQEVVQ